MVVPGHDEDDETIDVGITDSFSAANYIEYELLVTGIAALDEWRAVLARNPGYVCHLKKSKICFPFT